MHGSHGLDGLGARRAFLRFAVVSARCRGWVVVHGQKCVFLSSVKSWLTGRNSRSGMEAATARVPVVTGDQREAFVDCLEGLCVWRLR